MKHHHTPTALCGVILGLATPALAQSYVNHILQTQYPDTTTRLVYVDESGTQFSELPVDPGGSRFDLYTAKSDGSASYHLDSRFVGSYIPIANVQITSEDPYETIPRTRADRPFTITVSLTGLTSDTSKPEAAQKVRYLRHTQSYGEDGDGIGIDRSLATLIEDEERVDNGNHVETITLSAVPGLSLTKKWGEERITIYSLDDYQAPASQLASKFVQVWPVADGSISGISDGDQLRFSVPDVTITMNDLYPDSRSYLQIYSGTPVLGTDGTVIPGSGLIIYDTVPHDRTLVLDDWDDVIETSGEYTIELLTATPFGVDRLDYVTFTINRDIEVNGTVTTVE
ncbi:MAG: hypothetical protein AAGI48_06320 [Verrucomicrobiota bacterium]